MKYDRRYGEDRGLEKWSKKFEDELSKIENSMNNWDEDEKNDDRIIYSKE